MTSQRDVQIVPADQSSVELAKRKNVEDLLELYSKSGEKLTYEMFADVYNALRSVISNVDDCNAAALAVFEAMNSVDMPPSVSRQDIVKIAIEQRGSIESFHDKVTELVEKKKQALEGESNYTEIERLLGYDITDEAMGRSVTSSTPESEIGTFEARDGEYDSSLSRVIEEQLETSFDEEDASEKGEPKHGRRHPQQ